MFGTVRTRAPPLPGYTATGALPGLKVPFVSGLSMGVGKDGDAAAGVGVGVRAKQNKKGKRSKASTAAKGSSGRSGKERYEDGGMFG